MFHRLVFPFLLLIQVPTLRASEAIAQSLNPLPESSILVIPSHVKIGEWPVNVGRLPLGENIPYLFVMGGDSRNGLAATLPDIHEMRTASLSPDGRWIAYTAREGVVIADFHGQVLTTERGATSCAWNGDGSMLAVLFPPGDPSGAGVGIMRLKNGKTSYTRGDARALAWGARDTLFLERDYQIDAIDAGRRRRTETKRFGVEVSPDGLYSIARGVGHWSGVRIMADGIEVDLTDRTFGALGPFTPKHAAKPFWVPGEGHLLCVSACGDWPQRGGGSRWECRTGIVDVSTAQLLRTWPGMSLGTSRNGSLVWITDGDAVRPYRPADAKPGRAMRMRDVIVH